MIVFDLQAVQSAAHGERGIARYVSDLAGVLARDHPGTVDVFAWNDLLPYVPRLDQLDLGDRLVPFSRLRNATVDVLHVNSPFELLEYGEVGVPVRSGRLVVTCYDLIPYRFPDRYFTDPVARARYRTRLNMLMAADAIVTDSQSAADDVVEMLGVGRSRVTAIGAGVGPQFRQPVKSLAERMLELRATIPGLVPEFVLVPAGMDWRKNIEGAIEAFSRLPDDVRDPRQLVLSCKVDDGQRRWVEQLAADAGVADRVVVTGYVSDELLVTLYQSAELVLFPSFYEGFGLPVLEARRCGSRVICSNASSLPEVIGATRATFNPWSIEEMTDTLHDALVDPELIGVLDRIPDPGFTWEQTARRLVGVYDRVRSTAGHTNASNASTGPDRRRLAIVTLLPPTQSGIADHSQRLVEAIHHDIADIDVTVFVEELASWSADLPYPVRELVTLPPRWQQREFDEVLYCFGNNALHERFYPMLTVVPGHALLHDVRLQGAFNLRRVNLLARDVYDGNLDGDAMFARPIARSAESVLVQSEHAARLVAADGGGVALNVGPHPCAIVSDTSHLDDGGPPWVITAGIAHESKQTDLVVEAMRLLVVDGRTRAAVVGPYGDEFVDLDDDILATGPVDDDEFDRWLRSAAVLVQLRRTSNGESSGVAAHAMARGVPLVVSDRGAMAELPDGACIKVPVNVTAEQLAATITALLGDERRRSAMRDAGLVFAARETPLAQARRVVTAIFGPHAA